jgi:hypothetical protein
VNFSSLETGRGLVRLLLAPSAMAHSWLRSGAWLLCLTSCGGLATVVPGSDDTPDASSEAGGTCRANSFEKGPGGCLEADPSPGTCCEGGQTICLSHPSSCGGPVWSCPVATGMTGTWVVENSLCEGDAGPPSHDSGPPSYDATGPWSPVCPELVPSESAPCSQNNLYCEYGCGNVFVCADGTWGEANNTPLCQTGPNSSSCPAELSSIEDGGSCSGPSTGECLYPGGVCQCVFDPDPTPDASANGSWWCGPGPGCPAYRPRIGSPCDAAGGSCSYAQCGSTETCSGGYWQYSDEPCGGG